MELKSGKILAEIADGIGWVTLNNPERRNAVSIEMWQDIGEAFRAFTADGSVWVAVISGAGGKSFMAGADISQFEKERNSADAAANYDKVREEAKRLMGSFPFPIIAMIDGFCIGGGMAVALTADLRIASEGSQFGIPAARLGLSYQIDALQKLVSIVGLGHAKDIMFTARKLDAGEAYRIGLLNRLVAKEDLRSETVKLANQIAANAPLTNRASKFSLSQIARFGMEREFAMIETLNRACFDSSDYEEGRKAFMEKRTPKFQGR